MVRLIDEKKLIEQLRESNYHHASSSREEVLLDRTIRVVLEQPKADQWISVEERLPEIQQDVLVTIKRQNISYCDLAFLGTTGDGT